MPLYVADYLADTGHLTGAEHGAYLLLIMHYWSKRTLPTDDLRLASIARMDEKAWKKSKPIIQEFFGLDWKHERVEHEIAEADRLSAAGRTGGEASGRSRRAKSQQPTNDRSTDNERSFNDPTNDERTIEQRDTNDPPNDRATKREAPHSQSPTEAIASSVCVPTSSTSLEVKEVDAEQASGEFEEFYKLYPHKIGPKDAKRAFLKARKTADFVRIMDGLRAYIATKPDDRPWCNPATWLNQGRWDDQPAQINPQNRNGNHVQTTRDIGKAELKQALGELGDYIEASRADGGAGEEVVRPLPAAGRG
jgi:uncharacterized protein YdaU (DUF1376 family)